MIIKHYAKSIKGKAIDIDGSIDIYASDTIDDTQENMTQFVFDKAV